MALWPAIAAFVASGIAGWMEDLLGWIVVGVLVLAAQVLTHIGPMGVV